MNTAICNLLLILQSLPPPSHLRDGFASPRSRTSTSGHLSGSTCPTPPNWEEPKARRPPLSISILQRRQGTPQPNLPPSTNKYENFLSQLKKKFVNVTAEAEKLQSGCREGPAVPYTRPLTLSQVFSFFSFCARAWKWALYLVSWPRCRPGSTFTPERRGRPCPRWRPALSAWSTFAAAIRCTARGSPPLFRLPQTVSPCEKCACCC